MACRPPDLRTGALAAVLCTIFAHAVPATAETDVGPSNRFAVVIGNGTYTTTPLRNPPNDARRMAQVLRGLGFDVVELVDAGRTQMKAAVDGLRHRSRHTGVALFYFAGHGVHIDGENYLLPVDIDVTSETDIESKALRLGDILARLGSASERTNVVILDACRDDAFPHHGAAATKGLAAIDAPPGTLIAYATAPGKVAADGVGKLGLYTGALVDALQQPGLRIEDVFKQARRHVIEASGGAQVPWESSSLVNDLVLVPTAATADSPPHAAPAELAADSIARGAGAVYQDQEADGEERVTLGVMSFRSLGSTEHGFQREALRDALNTQLSQLSQVKVYSKEFLDFLVTRKGLTEIEAAAQLGISKLLSGSLVNVGSALRIETHVVDVETGLLELSCDVTGSSEDFLRLQNEMVLEVVTKLDLPLTAADEQLLTARRATDPALLELLLQAEGSVPQDPSDVAPTPTIEPRSHLQSWLIAAASTGTRVVGGTPLLPLLALAQDDDDEAAILGLLEQYRLATQTEEVGAVAALYETFPDATRSALQRYFDNVTDLKQSFTDIDIAVVGEEAVVSYTRTDEFTDARTGRRMDVSVRLTKTLVKRDGSWRLIAGQ